MYQENTCQASQVIFDYEAEKINNLYALKKLNIQLNTWKQTSFVVHIVRAVGE